MNVEVGHKLRFQVLTRDRFACQYCGRRAPHVHLEVDHIVPRSDKGPNTIDNLITCCYDCNRGKGKGRIGHSSIVNLPNDLDMLQARINKLVSIHQKALELARTVSDITENLDRYWWEALAGQPDLTFSEPVKAMLRYFAARLDFVQMMEVMALAWEQYHDPQGIRQVYRLAWREIDRETQVVQAESLGNSAGESQP